MISTGVAASKASGFCLIMLGLVYAITGSDARAETEALDPGLLDHARRSLNLSLCAVVFEEEHEDKKLANQYQDGSVRAELLIRQGGWSEEEILGAHQRVLHEDFSFTLSPEITWWEFRKSYFSRQRCDGALTSVTGQAK